jgi:hypothetical protein
LNRNEARFEAALLIYGDFCPLSPDQRQKLLANVRRALKPSGAFVLDVSRFDPNHPDRSESSWYSSAGGFWRPGPSLVLEQSFSYPEQALQMDQYLVIEETGDLSVYRNWRQEYTPESITAELAAGGFAVQSVWGDLTGIPLSEDAAWIGIISRKN